MKGPAIALVAALVVGTLAFAAWRLDAEHSRAFPKLPAESVLATQQNDSEIVVVEPVARVDASELAVASAPAPTAPTGPPPGPDAVPLPAIDGKPGTDNQQRTLRMLAHAMANAGRSCAMPVALTQQSWERLDAWLAPVLADRKAAADRSQKLAVDAVQAKLQAGQYEIRRTQPSSSSPDDSYGFRHAKDARGNDVVHVARIARGENADLDALRDRCKTIDRDIGILARDFFDRLSR